jgi:uncharacterized phage protein (TIGR01671 family)
MREIKFRGKRSDNGKWVYGGIWVKHKCPNTRILILDSIGERFEVDPETVGEYPGLKDKNDKEIYEGDIILLLLDKEKCEVSYNSSHCAYLLTNKYKWTDAYKLGNMSSLEIEVIGNIYENPELIK